jgi:hypothetical protein
MRLSLFILGVFSAVICIEKPAQAQNQAWCIYKDDGEGNPQCRYATLERCLADRLGNSNRAHRADAQAVTPSNGYGLRKSFGNFAFHCDRQKPIP